MRNIFYTAKWLCFCSVYIYVSILTAARDATRLCALATFSVSFHTEPYLGQISE
jgi:hypothetical protein